MHQRQGFLGFLSEDGSVGPPVTASDFKVLSTSARWPPRACQISHRSSMVWSYTCCFFFLHFFFGVGSWRSSSLMASMNSFSSFSSITCCLNSAFGSESSPSLGIDPCSGS
jgi:hypothetical protein